MTGARTRAVVIGGSIAGLLTACALREEYGEVVVLDRDDVPDEPLPRTGVPHARHSHALLARGREAIDELLPGLSDDLLAYGAIAGDPGVATRSYVGPRHLAPGPTGLTAVAVSRGLLEWSIRRRVTASDGITLVPDTSVLDLAFDDDGQTVTGVVVASRAGFEPHHTIEAALVVDASGRTARTTEWLERWGYPSPREERVRVDATYVTRRFVRPLAQPSQQSADVLVVLQPAIPGLPRGGIAIAQEDQVWSVSIVGYHGERPPTELPDFLAYLRRLSAPALAELAGTLEPLDDGATYRFPANVRRHYEELDVFPDGLLVVGDAMCAFDPTFGQGMTVAALEALELRECLRDRVPDRGGDSALAQRFFARAARHVDIPWMLVARNAPRPAGVPDDRPLAVRLQSRYVRALQLAAVGDPVLAAAFLRVTHLVSRPQSLLRPPYLWRVLTAALARAGRGSRVPTVRGGSRPAIGVWDPEGAVPTRPPVPARHIHLNIINNQTGKLQ